MLPAHSPFRFLRVCLILGAVSGRRTKMAKRTKWLKRSSWRSQEQGAAASVSPAFILGSQKLFWERIRGCRGCGCPGRILCCEIRRRAIKFNVWTNRKWRLHLNFPEAFGKDVRAVSRYLIFFKGITINCFKIMGLQIGQYIISHLNQIKSFLNLTLAKSKFHFHG